MFLSFFFLSKRLSVHSFIILILFIISISFFFSENAVFRKYFFLCRLSEKYSSTHRQKLIAGIHYLTLEEKKTRKKFLVYITEFPVIHVHIIFPLFFMFVLFMYLFSHIRISAIYRNNLHTKTKMLYISRMTVTLQSLFILI